MASKTESGSGTLSRVLGEIKQNKIAPVYLIFGDELYLVESAVAKLLSALVPEEKKKFGLELLDGETADAGYILESLTTDSLFSENKVVFVRHCRLLMPSANAGKLAARSLEYFAMGGIQESVRIFLEFLSASQWDLAEMKNGGWKKIPDDEWEKNIGRERDEEISRWMEGVIDYCVKNEMTAQADRTGIEGIEKAINEDRIKPNCLVMQADTVDRRRTLFKSISSRGEVLEFAQIKRGMQEVMSSQANQILGAAGKKIKPEAMLALGNKTGFDLMTFASELEKLISYTGKRTVIEASDVEAVVGKTAVDSIFSLTNAVAERNERKALRCLRELLMSGEEPMYIFGMIAREVRLLLMARIFLSGETGRKWNRNYGFETFVSGLYPAISGSKDETPGMDLYRLHPYQMFLYLQRAEKFTVRELINERELLLNTDQRLKRHGDFRLILEMLVIDLCRKKAA